ncbi:hypothetical protein DVH24_011119 [Malus domestica]|uniref:Uncharacterized protein n=1 Tax=Malus domestica TaxID=3750 RepID=A0A498JYC1_MALDO|nr:hypothetical protein DVH24_011119 [Malus domestica]
MDCRERKRGMSQNLEQGHVRPIRARFHHPFFSSSLLSRLSLLTTHFVSPDSLFATRNGLSNEYPIKSGETRGDVAPNHHQSKDVASKSPPIEDKILIRLSFLIVVIETGNRKETPHPNRAYVITSIL